MVNLRTEEKNGKLVLYLKGRLDVQSSSKLEEELDALLKEHSNKDFVVDMEGVEYLSSTGLRILITLMRNLKDKGRELRLSSLKEPVKKVFDIVQLDEMFAIYDSLDEALKA